MLMYVVTLSLSWAHTELLGTPGYLAPEMIRRSVEAGVPGYGKEIDL